MNNYYRHYDNEPRIEYQKQFYGNEYRPAHWTNNWNQIRYGNFYQHQNTSQMLRAE